jgi:hypothetical protein
MGSFTNNFNEICFLSEGSRMAGDLHQKATIALHRGGTDTAKLLLDKG